MRRISLFWAISSVEARTETKVDQSVITRLRNTINTVAKLDTAWIDFVIEVPSDWDIGELRGYFEEQGSLDWLHFSAGQTNKRKELRLRQALEFEAEAIGFLDGNEILPKDTVFRWLELRGLTDIMLNEYGVVLASLPAGTVISPNLFLDNVHHASFTAATVAFFKSEYLRDLIETPRSQWLSKYNGISSNRGGKILVVCEDAVMDEIVGVQNAVPTTQSLVAQTIERFEINVEVLDSFWANP